MSTIAIVVLACSISALIRPRALGPWIAADFLIVALTGSMALTWCVLLSLVLP
jgi:hypothetical protein